MKEYWQDKRKLNWKSYAIMVLIGFLVTAGFILGTIYYHQSGINISSTKDLKMINDPMICANMSLQDTSYCLRDWAKSFYIGGVK